MGNKPKIDRNTDLWNRVNQYKSFYLQMINPDAICAKNFT